MALILRPPWTRQPQTVARLLHGGVTLATSKAVVNARGAAPAALRGFYDVSPTTTGLGWDANTSAKSIDIGTSGSFYGLLMAFDMRVAALTSTDTRLPWLAVSPDNTGVNGLQAGNTTSFLTNETICLVDNTSNRSGITDTIAVGPHVLVVQWDAETSRYDFWLDGQRASVIHTATPIGLQSGLRYFNGRGSAGSFRFVPSLIAVSENATIDLRGYALRYWQLFAPRTISIPLAAVAGGGLPTLSNASATSITTTTAVPVVDYAY